MRETRYEKIIIYINKNKYATVEQLVAHTKTSAATVRRDIIFLSNHNRIEKTSGGAKAKQISQERTFNEKININVKQKRKIAKYIVDQIPSNSTIFLDGGSTTFQVANMLTDKTIKIITNNIMILNCRLENAIYLIGGKYKVETDVIIVSDILSNLANITIDFAILGCNAIDESSIYTTSFEEAENKEKIAKHATTTFILCDAEKLYKTNFIKIFDDNKDITIITDGTLKSKKHNIINLKE